MEIPSRKHIILIVTVTVVVLLVAVGLTVGLTLGLKNENDSTGQNEKTPAPTTTVPGTPVSPTVPGTPVFPTVNVPGVYHRAAVATDYGPCSDMGRDILRAGGSAVDTAITSTLCLGVASPQSSGLGGGLFMVIYKNDGSMESITANEVAPAASDFDMFVNDTDEANYGAKAVSVPGELAGLWAAHQRYGVLPWEGLLAPVIDLAQNGFPLAWHTEYTLKILQKNFDRWPILRELYTKPDGSLMEAGDIITAPAGMIRTLRAISDQGLSAFYGGEVGRKLVEDIQNQGGIMSIDDLTAYDVTSQPPAVLNMKDSRRVLSTPVTSSGNLVQFTVSILDQCNLQSIDFSTYDGRLKMYHYFIEASTFAVGLRSHIGDAGTPEVNKTVAALSSVDYARMICSMINATYITYPSGGDYDTFNDLVATTDRRTKRAAPGADQDEKAHGDMLGDTSHLSVYSENGDAVSLTTSVGRYFGSRTFSNQTGMFLNGHMGNFYYNGRTPVWDANRLAAGARAMSTMSPSIITDEDGSVKGVIGSSGGMRIISTNAWVLLRSLWGNEDLSDMIDTPRLYAYRSTSTSKIYYEKDFPEDLLTGLRAMGHNMVSTKTFAAAQGIIRQSGSAIYAYSDRRKGGYAAGY